MKANNFGRFLISFHLLLFLNQTSYCDFSIVTLRDDNSLSRIIIDDSSARGIKWLEPLQGHDYLCWTQSKLPSESDYFIYKSPLPPSSRLSPEIIQLHGQTISGRVGFWFFEDDDPDVGRRWILDHGGIIIHDSEIQMAAGVHYRIYGAAMPPTDLLEIIAADHLRYTFRESGYPGLEDEISSLQILVNLSEPATGESVFDVTKKLRVTGQMTRVGIIDTGLDTNNKQTCHKDLQGRMTHYIRYPGSPGFDYIGHGTHTAGIIAGKGALNIRDEFGFNLGMGIAHESWLSISDALLAAPFPPMVGYAGMIRDIASTGAKICNNSWNDGQGTGIGYHPNCALWDAAVRDADPLHSFASAWPMTIIFSSGNQGPDPQTITSPKEAKNIITVGAAGSLRSGNPDDIFELSSRGPCLDGRFAPTISAPGESIYSAWPVDAYQSSSGSSSAAAHVTGAAVLIKEWWRDRLKWEPSPALMKAIIILSSITVTDTIPDPGHGWGRLAISSFQPDFPATSVIDQSRLFTDPGQEWTAIIIPETPESIVDVVLVWTDPPAAPGANPALINNLDLSISSDGLTYFGNNFESLFSIPGGSPDSINNVERIRLPETRDSLLLTVKAADIRGDGLPSNDDPTDQDFAVVIKGGFLVSDSCAIQCDRVTPSSTDTIKITVTSKEYISDSTVPVLIQSHLNSSGLSINLPQIKPNSGVFSGSFFTGNEGRPNEIAVSKSDQLSISLDCNGDDVSIFVPVDGHRPRFQDFRFEKITSDQTDIFCSCSELCELQFHYKPMRSGNWLTSRSNLISNEHTISIINLDPCTEYLGFLTALDRSGNSSVSTDYFDEIHWSTGERSSIYLEILDVNPGFTQLDGLWQFGEPEGIGIPPDPISGFTGTNVLGYNLHGNYTNQLLPQCAVSPQIDCSFPGSYLFSFYRWLGTESSIFDQATVSAKDSSGEWHEIWKNPYFEIRDSEWVRMKFDITSYASENDSFQFMFTQGPTDSGFSRCGWNIDDMKIEMDVPCQPTPTPFTAGYSPEITLELNNDVFFPGDWFQLACSVFSDGAFPNLALAVILTVREPGMETQYFFPGWTTRPEIVEIPHPDSGQYQISITQFEVPRSFDKPLNLYLEGFLIDTTSMHILAYSEQRTAVLFPDQNDLMKVVD